MAIATFIDKMRVVLEHRFGKNIMVLRKKKTTKTASGKASKSESTLIWGGRSDPIECGDFVKVPRALLRLHRFHDGLASLKPKHIMLLLVIASYKFGDKRIRIYWEELADDLGVERDTVRKWAYELKKQGLLNITPVRGRDPEKNRVGYRNDRNVFDLTPFILVVQTAFAEKRRRSRPKRQPASTVDE